MRTSDSIKSIAKAISAFQAEVKNPANTEENPFFKSKYAPLNDILNLVRPLLSKHGLSIIQSPAGDGQNIAITTLITHESGEWIESDPLTLKADKATAQGAGSAITYARRYALSAMLGISSEDDDDGNNASAEDQKPRTKQTTGRATENQLKAILAITQKLNIQNEDMQKMIKAHYKKDSSKELTKTDASDLIGRLKEMEEITEKERGGA